MLRAFSELIRWFSRPDDQHTSPRKTSPRLCVLLWAPAYDAQTQHTSSWLATLAIPASIDKQMLDGPLVTTHDVRRHLGSTNGDVQLAIFCGHGIADALLGPPRGDTEDLQAYGGKHSRIYDHEMFPAGPTLLFAFCCRSAQVLGRRFASLPNRAFLGYDDDLLLNVRDEECRKTWQEIIGQISTALITDVSILPKHKQVLRRLYMDAFNYFRDGAGRTNPESWEMQMALLRQAARIQVYGGDISVFDV